MSPRGSMPHENANESQRSSGMTKAQQQDGPRRNVGGGDCDDIVLGARANEITIGRKEGEKENDEHGDDECPVQFLRRCRREEEGEGKNDEASPSFSSSKNEKGSSGEAKANALRLVVANNLSASSGLSGGANVRGGGARTGTERRRSSRSLMRQSSLRSMSSSMSDFTTEEGDEANNNNDSSNRSGDDLDFRRFHDALGEAQHYVALSVFVYMFAKLREMAVLGYTEVDFREIDVNSYRPWNKREDVASRNCEDGSRGRGPAFDSSFSLSKSGIAFDSSVVSLSNSGTCTMRTSMYPSYLLNTLSAATIIRIVLTELEREKFVSGGGCDDNDTSLIEEFRAWVDDSKADQLDERAEEVILELRKKVAASRWKRAISAARISVKLGKLSQRTLGSRGSEKTADDSAAGDACDVVSEDGSSAKPSRKSSLRYSISSRRSDMIRAADCAARATKGWFALERRLIEDHFGIEGGKDDSQQVEPNRTEAALESRELAKNAVVDRSLIESMLDERLHTYFKKRSVLSRMIDSGIEVAWVGDRHRNEAIYCVCVCRDTRTVSVVFRGSVTAHNWRHNLKIFMTERPNPVCDEEYEGRTERVRLHTGFGLYLFRRRKDDGRTKYEEIADRIYAIGRELAPADGKFRVAASGHSLGGALATIFSFYAAADDRFTALEPVRTFTFAAPRVGDSTFAAAYAHLERTGRVMHARFANTRDIVPLTPMFSMEGMRFGHFYKHVGLQIKLHEVNGMEKWRMRHSGVDVTHSAQTGWRNVLSLAWKNSLVPNLNTLGGYTDCHRLSTHQKRLNFTRQYRAGLGQTVFFANLHKRDLKSLEDYYKIKFFGAQSSSSSRSLRSRRRERTMLMKACVISFTCVAIFWVVCTSFSLPCCSLKSADKTAAIVSEEPIQREARDIAEGNDEGADSAFPPIVEAIRVEATQSTAEIMVRNTTHMDSGPAQEELTDSRTAVYHADEAIGAEVIQCGTDFVAENITDVCHVSARCEADQERDRETFGEVDAIAAPSFPATTVGRWGARTNAVPFFRPRNASVPRELVELAASASLDAASNATKEAAKAAKTFFQGEGRIQVEDRTKSLMTSTLI